MAGGTSTTTRTEPWEAQKEYLTRGFGAQEALSFDPAGNLRTAQYYGGPTLAGFDPAQQVAQRATLGYALGPRPQALQGASEAAQVRGLSGAVNTQVLDPMVESYRRKMESDLLGKTLPGIRQSLVQFQPGGSTRGDLIQGQAISSAQEALQNQVAQLYGGAYQAAQARVPQFQQMTPQVLGQPMGLYGAVGNVGADRRALTQEAINRDMMRHSFEQNAQQAALANYMAGISGDYGGTVTQTPSPISSLGSIAGVIGSLGKVLI